MSLHLQTPQYHPQPKQRQSHVGSANKVGCTTTNHSLDTLDLFDTKQSQPWFEFFHPESNQKRWEDQNLENMSKRSHGSNINNTTPKLDLKLNLSPPPPPARRSNERQESPPQRSASVSPPSSCVSSEKNGQEDHHHHGGSGLSPEATSMMLVGCPRCLMYVMLSEDDPKCPKCKSTVLLDFLHDNTNNNCSSSVSGSSKKTRKI